MQPLDLAPQLIGVFTPRWQWAPIIAGVVLAVAVVAWRRRSPTHGRLQGLTAVLAALSLVVGVALVALMPVRFLPAPTGPYAVGTTLASITDDTRPEIFTPAPNDRRTLPVQLWYPASPGATGRTEPYLRDAATFDGLADWVHVPRFLLRYLPGAPTHSLVDAPPVDGRFPVLVFVSGNMGYRQSNTLQVEELASQGYVVVAIDQPGTGSSVLLSDGRRVPYAGRNVVRPLVDQAVAPVTPAPTLNGQPFPRGLADYLAADPAAVLDQLPRIILSGPLAGHLDLDKVGAFGISLGGYVVSQWCATDRRVQACVFMDGLMTSDALSAGLDVPALWLTRPAADMTAEGWPPVEVQRFAGGQLAVFNATRAPAWHVEISGTRHQDFTDAPFGSPLFTWAGLTSDRADVVHNAMRAMTVAFFNRALKDATGPSVLDTRPWPGVQVQAR